MCASFTGFAGLAKRDGVRQVANKQLHYDVFHADSMKRFGWILLLRRYSVAGAVSTLFAHFIITILMSFWPPASPYHTVYVLRHLRRSSTSNSAITWLSNKNRTSFVHGVLKVAAKEKRNDDDNDDDIV